MTTNEQPYIGEGDPCPECGTSVEICAGADCYCHISPPCESCIHDGLRCPSCSWRLSHGVPADYVAHEPEPLPAREHVAPWTASKVEEPPAPPPLYRYLSGSKLGVGWRAGVQRISDGVTVWSSYWGVDDGSAECEASERMQALEARERAAQP